MAFICVLAALVLDHLRPVLHPTVFELWFTHYANRLARDMNAGQPVHGTLAWFLAVVPWVAVVVILHYGFASLSYILGWVWDAAVLYSIINFKRALQDYATAIRLDTFPPNLLLQDPNGRSLRGFDL